MSSIIMMSSLRRLSKDCFKIATKNLNFCNARLLSSSPTLLKFKVPKYDVTKKEMEMRIKDKLPEDFRLVYNGTMHKTVHVCHFVSGTSCLAMSAFLTCKLVDTYLLGLDITHFFDKELALFTSIQLGVYLSFFIALNVSLYWASSRCTLRVYRRDNVTPVEYRTLLVGLIPFTKRQVKFYAGDLRPVQGLAKMFPWRDFHFSAGSESMLLFIHFFTTPSELHQMLGEKF